MKTPFPLALLFICFVSCSDQRKNITRLDDYQSYLINRQVGSPDPIQEEMAFWNKRLKKNKGDEASLLKIAGLHEALFKSSGLVRHILLSDSLYRAVLKKYPEGNVAIYHSLASNAIAQHQFQLAKNYAEKALALKDKRATSLLILADVSLELGDYAKAKQILKQFKNKNSFAYLIREAKLKDHEGHLDSAIVRMQKAYKRVKGNSSLAHWTLSNLGDMYGHAGKIEDSYQTYLDVLKLNPNDDHVLKGIAWIALSNDHNISDAKKIINALAARKRMPEAHLMLAEIAAMESDEKERLRHLKKFKDLVSPAGYRTMYHKYLALLESEDFNNPDASVAIAKEEIANRPTPQSFDLLAWAYYHQKKYKQALDVASRHVQDQTFEPESYYHLGMIYQANGYPEQAQHYLEEALRSDFELGPSISKKITTALQNL